MSSFFFVLHVVDSRLENAQPKFRSARYLLASWVSVVLASTNISVIFVQSSLLLFSLVEFDHPLSIYCRNLEPCSKTVFTRHRQAPAPSEISGTDLLSMSETAQRAFSWSINKRDGAICRSNVLDIKHISSENLQKKVFSSTN